MTERAVVVIPTYDERENLPRIVAAVLAAEPDVHVLVVDDASPDGTGALADELAKSEPRVRVMHRRGKEGLGRAYLDAFARLLADPIGYTHVIQIDADFSHDPCSIGALRRACREGADVAVGSRWTKGGGTQGWPRSRQWMSKGGSRYASLVLGVPVRDLTAGFKCWRREVLEALPLDRILTAGYGFQIEMTTRAVKLGFRVVEVPITFTDRTVGTSKMSGAIFREALIGVWKLRRALAR
ncbi:MAG TPA: polyprenol monophosphomannose synthase [Nannocystaceae bacterium]|nr:polyprenol monophosphomannose synthase [Nannocystaceae bacterium]